mmetsp:Transcript_57898/g.188233  ORF Transcript_57898/g.188233 Transcript_57898/m.188233 type:complete len:274 (+) Transcript_57898:3113-3934(+)
MLGMTGATETARASTASNSLLNVFLGAPTRLFNRFFFASSSPALSKVGCGAAGKSFGKSRRISVSTLTRPPVSEAFSRSVLIIAAKAPRSGSTRAAMRPPRAECRKAGVLRPREICRTSPGWRSNLITYKPLPAIFSASIFTASGNARGSLATKGTREAIWRLRQLWLFTVPLYVTSRRSKSSIKMSESSSKSRPWSGCAKGRGLARSAKTSVCLRNCSTRRATRSPRVLQLAATTCSGSQWASTEGASRGKKRCKPSCSCARLSTMFLYSLQ